MVFEILWACFEKTGIIDWLGIEMDQQRRYEMFDRIYKEGMRENRVGRNKDSR